MTPPARFSLDASTGDLLWNTSCGESVGWTWIAATNQDVYLCGPDRLLAMVVEGGTPTMERELRDVLPGTISFSHEHILAGTLSNKVYCYGE
ncbi:MAG: hypothetical protein SWK76_05675 [Actinomycetota bacterium]|nr:hypothetical protein [Actinomycetota bacterium]